MWISVTLTNGKSAAVDFSKVIYFSERENGCTLHLQHDSINAKGKAVPLALGIRQSLDFILNELKAKR